MDDLDDDNYKAAVADRGLDDAVAYPVDLNIPETSNATRSKVGIDECEAAGVPTLTASSPSI